MFYKIFWYRAKLKILSLIDSVTTLFKDILSSIVNKAAFKRFFGGIPSLLQAAK